MDGMTVGRLWWLMFGKKFQQREEYLVRCMSLVIFSFIEAVWMLKKPLKVIRKR